MSKDKQSDTYSVSAFKAQALGILDGVRRTGRPVTVVKRGKPIARVVPIEDEAPARRELGTMKDTVIQMGDLVSPLGGDDWFAAQ